MRLILLFFSLFVFVTELSLDGSTAFVRESYQIYTLDASTQAKNSSGPSKKSSSPRIVVESHSHSAVPQVIADGINWNIEPSNIPKREIRVPVLNPPRSRIERPPIS